MLNRNMKNRNVCAWRVLCRLLGILFLLTAASCDENTGYSDEESAELSLHIYTNNTVRATSLPGDPGTGTDRAQIRNVHLFAFLSPLSGTETEVRHIYLTIPDTVFYVFARMSIPRCTANLYAVVNAGEKPEWDGLTKEEQVKGLVFTGTPTDTIFAGTLLNQRFAELLCHGTIYASPICSKIDLLYNLGEAITNYNNNHVGAAQCTAVRMVSAKMLALPSEGYYFDVNNNNRTVGNDRILVENPIRSQWVNGRFDCLAFDAAPDGQQVKMEMEIVVESDYSDGRTETTVYKPKLAVEGELSHAPYYLLRFNIVGFREDDSILRVSVE